jgi:hypothetical protein
MAGTASRGGSGRSAGSDLVTLELYRGRARLALIRDLALGEWTYRELANQLKVPVVEVATFAAMNADEVTEVRGALAGEIAIETAGLWISKRVNRVAEYQAMVDELRDDIDAARRSNPGGKEHNNLVRSWNITMRNAADEFLPSRVDKAGAGDSNVVHYVLEADEEIVQALT